MGFLDELGDPYAKIAADPVGRTGLNWGSYGVPETFVIDGNGVIRYQHIGDVREENVAELLAQLREAE